MKAEAGALTNEERKMIYKETSSEKESDESSDEEDSLFDAGKAIEEISSDSSEINDDRQAAVPSGQSDFEEDSPEEEEIDSHATVFLSEDSSSKGVRKSTVPTVICGLLGSESSDDSRSIGEIQR